MIYTMSIKDFNKHPNKGLDGIFLIVRSITILQRKNDFVLKVAEHLPLLSPSQELFFAYRGWVNQGIWNQETFNKLYRPAFELQIKQDKVARQSIQVLAKHSQDQDIVLLCYCDDVNLCHRKIIGEMIQKAGGIVDIK